MASSDASSLPARVAAYIREHDLLAPGQAVVVGLSGGVDSMGLAALLHRLGYAVTAAHVNYGLRGAASDADEELVRTWCAAHDPPVPLHVTRCDPTAQAAAAGRSLQAVARDQRYAFMARCAEAAGIDRVAVAHHRDDQAETVLLNLVRGSGLEGLAGMAPRRPLTEGAVTLVRPLLAASRADIEAYADAAAVPWRPDASNASLAYDRNAMRHRVLPVMEEQFEGAADRIARAAALVRAYRADTVEPTLAAHMARCAQPLDDGGLLKLDALRTLPAVWRRRVILEALRRWLPEAPYHAALAAEVDGLLDAQVGRRVEVGDGAVWRERAGLRFVPTSAPPAPSRSVPYGEAVALPQGTLRVERIEQLPAALGAEAPHTVYADAQRLQGPLTVRPWRAGDRFQPLGMTHSKKISDFLTDEKVPPHRRRHVLVVCDRERIVWVVGHRLAHPVRIRPGTEHAVRMAVASSVETR